MPIPHGRAARRPPQTRNGAAPATPSYSLVPPGGFEPSTPALGGLVFLSELVFYNFIQFYITACKTACFKNREIKASKKFYPNSTQILLPG